MQVTGLKGFHLSSQQTRLWSLQGPGRTYNILCAALLEGELHTDMLDTMLLRIVNRHEILRTAFYFIPGMDVPMQVVTSCPAYQSTLVDLRALDSQYSQLDECMVALQEETWDLEHGPLLHTWLLRFSSDTHILLMGLPALCADSHTLKLLVYELEKIYNSCRQDEDPDEEPLQYSDGAAWQEELLREEGADLERHYWHMLDLSLLVTMRLPFEREHNPADWSSAKRLKEVIVPPELDTPPGAEYAMRLQSLSQEQNSTISTVLLACWFVVLWRLCQEEHIIIGLSCNGRIFEEMEDASGLYTRFVPVEAYFDRDIPFVQFLSIIRKSTEEAVKRQMYFSWDSLSGTNKNAYFPISFEYDACPAACAVGSLAASFSRASGYTEPFALKLSALLQGQRLDLRLHYDEARAQRYDVERVASALYTLLQDVVADPTQSIGKLRILPLAEEENLRRTFGAPHTAISPQRLSQLFEKQVERVPGQLAVLSLHEQLTYYDLNCRANQLAHVLQGLGIGPNILVGLYFERSVDMIVALLAVLKAGGAYVPLDPEHPATRLAYQLRDLQIPLVLTRVALLARLPDWKGSTFCIDAMKESIEREPTLNLPVMSDPLDLAYVMYTSGSTGKPKGVLIRQQSIVNYTLSLCSLVAKEPGLHFALTTTLAADLGNTAIFCALASGGCVQILDYEIVTSSDAFARWVEHHPIDVLKIVPSHLSALLVGEHAHTILPRRVLILGGEVFPGKLLARLRELGAGCRILNHYGPTEATIGALVNELAATSGEEGSRQKTKVEFSAIPLGRPVAGSEIYILDRRFQIVPVGVTGELYIAGAGLALGYWHLPEQTAQSFLPHAFAKFPGARMYRTGDLARYSPQGFIEFVGRSDNQMKIRGYRVELGEIEAVVRQYPNVRDVVVASREDASGEPRLVCYVVARYQPLPGVEELRSYIRGHIPEYMVPSAYALLDAIPLTTNGKVDLERLPMPEYRQKELAALINEPRSPIEEILCDIWKDLLHVPVVHVHDNFFQSGGHSLLATQVISQVRTLLRVEISVLSLFEAPTIAQFAQRVVQALNNEQAIEVLPLVPVERGQNLPLSFAQQRLWFLDRLEPHSPAYLSLRAYHLQGPSHLRDLTESLRALICRHESLRTTFQEQAGRPIQVIHPGWMLNVPLADLSGLTQEERSRQVLLLTAQEEIQPVDLVQGPLLRVFLIRLDATEHVLLLTMHHIITDGWSNELLVRELAALYRSFEEKEHPALPPLPIQYADYAVWQHSWLQGPVLEKLLAYWKRCMEGAPPTLELPTDHPRPFVPTYRGAHYSFELAAPLIERLRIVNIQEGVTLFMTLLAVFKILLAYYAGQEDIVVGSPVANREHQELENLLGLFVNTLVLRTDLSGNPTFHELLQRVRHTCIGAYAHEDLPFEVLVEALQPDRQQGRSPFFQVMFMHQTVSSSSVEMGGLTIAPVVRESESMTTKFDLTLGVFDCGSCLNLEIEYNSDLFERSTIEQMERHYQLLIERAVADPSAQIHFLCSVLEEEDAGRQLIDAFNDDLEG